MARAPVTSTFLRFRLRISNLLESIRQIRQERVNQSRKFASNFLWLAGENVFRLGVGLVVGLAIARQLGPIQYGILSYAMATAALCGIIAALGLDEIVQRDLVKAGPTGWNSVLGTAFILRLGSAFALYAAYAAVIVESTPTPETRTACLVIGLQLLVNPATLFRGWFQTQMAAKYAVLAQNIGFCIATVIRIYLVLRREATVYALSWIFVGELALSGILVAVVYGRVCPGSPWRWSWSGAHARRWAGEGWTQLLSGLAIFAYMRIDQIMLEKMAGARAVGIYSAAVKISEIGYFIPVMLGATLLPSVIRTRQSDQVKYIRRRQLYFDLSALIAVALAVPTSIMAPWIVPFLFGANFSDASHILALHAWSALFVFTGVARGQYLLTEGLLRFSFVATVSGAIVNVGLNIVLIPRWGGIGAAWATLIAYAISSTASSFVYAPTRLIALQQLRSFNLLGSISRLTDRKGQLA